VPGTLSLRGLWPPGLARAAGPGGREVALDLARALMVEARPCRDRPPRPSCWRSYRRASPRAEAVHRDLSRPTESEGPKGSHAMDLRPEVDLEAGMRVRHPRSGHDGHAAEDDVRSGGLERVECRRARHESRKWRLPRRQKKPRPGGRPGRGCRCPEGAGLRRRIHSIETQPACTGEPARRRPQAPSPARATPAAAMPSVEGSGTAETCRSSIRQFAVPALGEPLPL